MYLTSPRYYTFGFTNPNLNVPELCTSVYTNLSLLVTLGSGRYYGFYATYQPALVGSTLFAQAFVPDASQPGIPLQASNGVALLIPAFPSAGDREITRVSVGVFRGVRAGREVQLTRMAASYLLRSAPGSPVTRVSGPDRTDIQVARTRTF